MHQFKDGEIVRVRKEFCDKHPEAFVFNNFGYKFLKLKDNEKFVLLGGVSWNTNISADDLELWIPRRGDIVSITHPSFHHKSMILWCVEQVRENKVECIEYGDFGLYDGAFVDLEYVIPFNLKKHILYPSMWKEAKSLIAEHFPEASVVFTHIESWREVDILDF